MQTKVAFLLGCLICQQQVNATMLMQLPHGKPGFLQASLPLHLTFDPSLLRCLDEDGHTAPFYRELVTATVLDLAEDEAPASDSDGQPLYKVYIQTLQVSATLLLFFRFQARNEAWLSFTSAGFETTVPQ
jgi:hypothetical protein